MYSRLSDAWVDDISLESETSISANPFTNVSTCDGSWKHVKSCKICKSKLRKIIDMEVDDRLDRLMLEKKLSKIKDFQWKDAAMVGLGAAVVVLLFMLVLKQK